MTAYQPPSLLKDRIDTLRASANAAVQTSLLPTLNDYLDTLAATFADKHDIDVDLARVMLARASAEMSDAAVSVSIAQALGSNPVSKDLALASGVEYASALHARFPLVRTLAGVVTRTRRSARDEQVSVRGWRFAIRARTR